MTTPQQPQPVIVAGVWTLRRILLVIAGVLFVVASLCAGGVIAGWPALAFAFGGFASWALSGAAP